MRRARGASSRDGAGSGASSSCTDQDHLHESSHQPKSSHVQVVVRGRPVNEREQKSGLATITQFHGRQVTLAGRGKGKPRTFTFDGAFGPDKSQEDIYDSVVQPIVTEALSGFNCTIFAYGQTGTGKTHTMQGMDFESADAVAAVSLNDSSGIVQRAVTQVFETLNRTASEFSVRVSYLEIYNEEIRDLLAPGGISSEDLKLFVAPQGGAMVHGLEEVPCSNPGDVFKEVHKGVANRITAETQLNSRSSRSHSIFSIMVHTKETGIDGEDVIRLGKLNLVDLAGSENIKRSGAQAQNSRKREAGNINQSLLTLGRVINALTEGQPHVPYRESKLTRLLQDSLGGKTKTCIIATMSPASDCYEETVSTLEYAQRAKHIKNTPAVNEKTTKRALMNELTGEIDKLRQDLIAARSGDGFFISHATYNELEQTKEEQAKNIAELELKIAGNAAELAKVQQLFAEEQEKLQKTEAELTGTKATLEVTEVKLEETAADLTVATKTVKQSKAIISERERVEEDLAATAEKLQEHARAAHRDIEALHGKVDRKAAVEETNHSHAQRFSTHVATRMDSIRQDTVSFHESHKGMTNEVVASIDGFRDGITERLAALEQHFTATEQHTAEHAYRVTPAANAFAKESKNAAKQWNSKMTRLNNGAEKAELARSSQLEEQVAVLRQALASLSEEVQQWSDGTKARLNDQVVRVEDFMESHSSNLEAMAGDIDAHDLAQRQQIEEQKAAIAAAQQKQAAETEAMQTATLAQVTKALAAFAAGQQAAMAGVCTAATDSLESVREGATARATEQAAEARGLAEGGNAFSAEFASAARKETESVCTDLEQAHATADATVGAAVEEIGTHHTEWMRAAAEQRMSAKQLMSDCAKTHTEAAQSFSSDVTSAVGELSENSEASLAQTRQTAAGIDTFTGDVQVSITGKMVTASHDATAQLESVASNLHATRDDVQQFFSTLKKDTPTGQTPVKTVRTFPTAIARTRPHEEIIASMPKTPMRDSTTSMLENIAN